MAGVNENDGIGGEGPQWRLALGRRGAFNTIFAIGIAGMAKQKTPLRSLPMAGRRFSVYDDVALILGTSYNFD